MSHSSLNETFVLICLGIILAAPFLFRMWLNRYPVRTMESVDRTSGHFSLLIFIALFMGGFIFDDSSRRAGMILLLAAIFSFYALYQSRYRYLKPSPLQTTRAHFRAPSWFSQNLALRKIIHAALFFTMVCLMAKFPLLLPMFFLAYPFAVPYLVRLQNPCVAMAESHFKEEIKTVFKRAQVKLKEIYFLDSTTAKSDAMIAKNTLFVTVELFQKLNESEIKAVICHEASHLQQYHLWKRMGFSALAFFLGVFWILFPATFLVTNSKQIFLTLPLIALFQLYFLARTVKKQEFQADLGAIHLGASSEALISALNKLSGQINVTPAVGIFAGNFHPTLAERIAVIQSGIIAPSPHLFYKKYAYAYSLLVLGFVFHQAQSVQLAVNRLPANQIENSAKVSHPATQEINR